MNRLHRLRSLLLGVTLGTFVAGCAIRTPAPEPASATEASAGYIVQSASVDQAALAVEAVGGAVTHELGIIRAVGATLTADQVEALRAMPDVRRVFEDATVKTSSACALAAGDTIFENNKFRWTLTNAGTSAVTLGSLSIAWPSVNGTLKKLKFDGADIWNTAAAPPYVQITDDWHDDVDRRRLGPGQSAELKFEFDENIDWAEANYTIFVDFQEGCSLQFTPRVMDCRSNGLASREFNGKKVKWVLPNEGTDAITISQVSVNWPEQNGELKKMKLGSSDIFTGFREAPVTTVADGWYPDITRRRIDPGNEQVLEIEFGQDIDLDQEAHSIIVEFSEGCQTEFVPGNVPVGGDQKVDKKARKTHYVSQVGADQLHADGVTGAGVTVAVLDTGVWSSGGGKNWLRKDYGGNERVLRTFDAIENVEGDAGDAEDKNGHGSHVTSIILSSRRAQGSGNVPVWNGVAPGVSLVAVKAFDEHGHGSYMDVIRGIDWVVQNKDVYGIRVLNLSLSAPPRSHYWDDPLNQAVMEAWRAGLVVVASAGNTGPDAMSIGVPGNVPYVITVGAMTDNRTPLDASDDRLTSFSAAGPTYEGFVKPELVAPGGRLLGVMNKKNRIPKEHKDFHDGNSYYYMSGTSQAAAVVSGVAALMLEAEPGMTPDQVKCKLIAGARPAVNPDGSLAFSIFQQGAGLVSASAAVDATEYDCANRGLDIDADLAGTRHFGGRANQHADGSFYLMGLDGFIWTDGFVWTDGYVWTDSYVWTDGFVWTDGYLWTDGTLSADGYVWTDGFVWTDAYVWTDGFVWTDAYIWTDGLTETMSINHWVEQE